MELNRRDLFRKLLALPVVGAGAVLVAGTAVPRPSFPAGRPDMMFVGPWVRQKVQELAGQRTSTHHPHTLHSWRTDKLVKYGT